MKFLTLFSAAQAASIFNLLPAAFQESLELIMGDDSAASTGKKLVPGNSGVEQCQVGRPQLLNITDLTLDPALPVAGQDVTIDASGFLLGNVTEGSYVDVFVKYGLINVFKTRYELCTYLPEVGYDCPTGPGEISFSKDIELPETVGAGEYLIIAKAFTPAGDMLTCLYSELTVGA